MDQWKLLDIPQQMLRVDEVITRIEVSIVFDDRNITAGFSKDTQCMLLPESSSGYLLENLNFDPLNIMNLPLVKDCGEEIAPSVGRYSAVANAALTVWLGLDQGQKANIGSFDLLEEPVDIRGVLNVPSMHNAQYITRDVVLLQEPVTTHRFLVGGVLALGDPVLIMHLLRPIEAKAYGEALCRQKLAPVLIEESTVCLDTVGDALVTGLMLTLHRHDLAKVVYPQEGRLTSMPGKVDHRTGGGGDVLDNVLLQDGVGHTKRLFLGIEVFLPQVVTIVTV